jgi:hypothetical protein
VLGTELIDLMFDRRRDAPCQFTSTIFGQTPEETPGLRQPRGTMTVAARPHRGLFMLVNGSAAPRMSG